MRGNITRNQKKEINEVSFCLIIPMFNEENNVRQCVDTFCQFLAQLENRCELLIVDDGSILIKSFFIVITPVLGSCTNVVVF